MKGKKHPKMLPPFAGTCSLNCICNQMMTKLPKTALFVINLA